MEEKLNEIDTGLTKFLNILNPTEIQYIYGSITQQPIQRKWNQQAQLRQPPEFDFTWSPPTNDSVLTRVVLLDYNISLDDYKNEIIYLDTYLVKRLYEIFGNKCVNQPDNLTMLSHMNYGDVFQLYIFYKKWDSQVT